MVKTQWEAENMLFDLAILLPKKEENSEKKEHNDQIYEFHTTTVVAWPFFLYR